MIHRPLVELDRNRLPTGSDSRNRVQRRSGSIMVIAGDFPQCRITYASMLLLNCNPSGKGIWVTSLETKVESSVGDVRYLPRKGIF